MKALFTLFSGRIGSLGPVEGHQQDPALREICLTMKHVLIKVKCFEHRYEKGEELLITNFSGLKPCLRKHIKE